MKKHDIFDAVVFVIAIIIGCLLVASVGCSDRGTSKGYVYTQDAYTRGWQQVI